ncbi:MAG: hypothetical protein A2049_11400 [Elusimicrobia bacterium GWA2_62_23]|nr:MAG: hypothetical protein A2049_11400 [Elusimicrobia bacterium GWA2_62_23]OGR67178.1 MAG: hypothetical protein A2179_00425 [Elusimicrobia bacterium GWC2_63_65]
MTRLLLPLLLFAAAGPAMAQEIAPQRVQAEELAQVRDRLMTSLFFRGELADLMLAAGEAGKFVDLDEVETNSEARGLLLGWIKRHPSEAAEVYLHLRGGGRSADKVEIYRTSYELNANFLALIKNLNAAAGDKGVPAEALELAARRLYEGPQAQAEAPAVTAGAGGGSFFPGEYADHRLNKAGLSKELAADGAWLDALRGPSGRGPAGLEKYFGQALAEYAAFVTAAAAVKGRGAITAEESRALEARRAFLRGRLAALGMRARASELRALLSALEKARGEPGAEKILAALRAAVSALEARAEGIEAGGAAIGELAGLARAAEKEFSAAYLRASVYNGLLSLRRRAAAPRFSCFYDYVFFRYLDKFFPASPYPRARAVLLKAPAGLEAALAAAGAGDLNAALAAAEGDAPAIAAAAVTAERAARLNRSLQFFQWGLLARPVEYRFATGGGRPVFTFADILISGK